MPASSLNPALSGDAWAVNADGKHSGWYLDAIGLFLIQGDQFIHGIGDDIAAKCQGAAEPDCRAEFPYGDNAVRIRTYQQRSLKMGR